VAGLDEIAALARLVPLRASNRPAAAAADPLLVLQDWHSGNAPATPLCY
jgi:hypothetical protein